MDDKEFKREFMRYLIEEIMKKTPMKLTEEQKAAQIEAMLKICDDEMPAMEAMGFSNEMIESIYAYGFRSYNNGQYKKAKSIFTSLIIFQPNDARFYLGKGASCQKLGEWEEAAVDYDTCGQIDTDSPMPYFYMYECLKQLKLGHEAAAALGEVVKRCKDLDLFAELKGKALLLLKSVEQESKEPASKKVA